MNVLSWSFMCRLERCRPTSCFLYVKKPTNTFSKYLCNFPHLQHKEIYLSPCARHHRIVRCCSPSGISVFVGDGRWRCNRGLHHMHPQCQAPLQALFLHVWASTNLIALPKKITSMDPYLKCVSWQHWKQEKETVKFHSSQPTWTNWRSTTVLVLRSIVV